MAQNEEKLEKEEESEEVRRKASGCRLWLTATSPQIRAPLDWRASQSVVPQEGILWTGRHGAGRDRQNRGDHPHLVNSQGNDLDPRERSQKGNNTGREEGSPGATVVRESHGAEGEGRGQGQGQGRDRPHRRLAPAVGARRRLGLRRPAGSSTTSCLASADSRWERGEVVPLHGLNYSKLIEADGIVVEEGA